MQPTLATSSQRILEETKSYCNTKTHVTLCDKTDSKYGTRRFMFTDNTVESSPISHKKLLEDLQKAKDFKLLAGQYERGKDTGHLHYQGYVEFKNKHTLQAMVKRFHGPHWEAARKPREACISYCTKEDTAVTWDPESEEKYKEYMNLKEEVEKAKIARLASYARTCEVRWFYLMQPDLSWIRRPEGSPHSRAG